MPRVVDKGVWKHVKAAESGVNIREYKRKYLLADLSLKVSCAEGRRLES